jgi:hypothetical protein
MLVDNPLIYLAMLYEAIICSCTHVVRRAIFLVEEINPEINQGCIVRSLIEANNEQEARARSGKIMGKELEDRCLLHS